jgi:LCP family protein required for cell wall assembly
MSSKKETPKKSGRRISKRGWIWIIVAAVAVVAGSIYFRYHQLHSMLQSLPGGLGSLFTEEKDGGTESPEEQKAALEKQLEANLESKKDSSGLSSDLMNIMIVGVDSRDDDFTGRSDTMVLCSIDETNKHILMTSLLRDSYVAIPGHGSNRLNAAYAIGGADLMNETIKKNYGIDVDRTVVVNFVFVKEFVDAIDGIDLYLTKDEIKVMNNYIHDMNVETFDLADAPETDQLTETEDGTYHLNGKQALAYARDRYSIGSDFDRTGRQRKVIQTCMDKVKTMSLTDLNSLMEKFLPKIATDLTEGDCANLLLMIFHISDYSVDSMALPVEGTYEGLTINGMSVIGMDFDQNYEYWKEALQGNMPNSTPDATATPEATATVLPDVAIDDYSVVPDKTEKALENQAIAEKYAAHYNTSVQYVVDSSKAGICQFFDSGNNLLSPGDSIADGVIIRYYKAN